MPVCSVTLHNDTYLACMNHALSTEKEEIMGLLLGHVAEEVSDGRNGRPNFFVAIYLRYQYLSEVGGSYCNVEP